MVGSEDGGPCLILRVVAVKGYVHGKSNEVRADAASRTSRVETSTLGKE